MGVNKNEAWIISVLNDGDAKKAIVVAGSLRRVMTRKKIVALFAEKISEDARVLLREKFDLTVAIDQRIPDGVDVVDFSKIFAFSLNIFYKCVYLSVSTLVLQNSDAMFDAYNSFAAYTDKEKSWIDTSVFLFTPSVRQYKAMKTLPENEILNGMTCNGNGIFSNYFGNWIKKHKNTYTHTLDAKYNQRICLLDEKEIYVGLQSDLAIVNFVDIHPMDVADQIMASQITTLGIVESVRKPLKLKFLVFDPCLHCKVYKH